MSEAKQFNISKRAVIAAFELVKENAGTCGVDGQSIEAFEKDLYNNLYKLWNRMASGSYFRNRSGRWQYRKRTEEPEFWEFLR